VCAAKTAANGGSELLIFARLVTSDRDSDYAGPPAVTSSHIAVPPLGKPVAVMPLSGNRYPMTFRRYGAVLPGSPGTAGRVTPSRASGSALLSALCRYFDKHLD